MLSQYGPNPHYLAVDGEPLIVIGSGEHYGSAMNADFDFMTYLDEMRSRGVNHCRLFSGAYREIPGSFNITDNNLAPRLEAFLCPWRRSGDKWDLTCWDEAYWDRLAAIVRAAKERDVIVEYVLFCFWYTEALWAASPMHPGNTIQGFGPADKEKVYATGENSLLPAMDAFVKKAVETLLLFGNVYFEICNEAYSRHDGTLYDDWHTHIAQTIVTAAEPTGIQPLIAVNYANRAQRLVARHPHPAVAIANFHYAIPDAVRENYHLNMVVADDETGFAGQEAYPYRREAWRFTFSGGGIFSHLDYGFTVGHPDGSATVTGNTPGSGSIELRRQLGFLRSFLTELRVWEMEPMTQIFTMDAEAFAPVRACALAKPGQRYAIYFESFASHAHYRFAVPPGTYTVRWYDPTSTTPFVREDQVVHDQLSYLTIQPPLSLAYRSAGGENVVVLEMQNGKGMS